MMAWIGFSPVLRAALQCGRSSKAAEIAAFQFEPAPPLAASMWPQQQGCGNRDRDGQDDRVGRASMWPQQQGCGNVVTPAIIWTNLILLQCGRSSKAAEIALTMRVVCATAELQCGRSSKAAEIRARSTSSALVAMLQCGRSSKAAEMLVHRREAVVHRAGFNVAAAARLRKSPRRMSSFFALLRFNVAAAARLRKFGYWVGSSSGSTALQCGRSSKAAEILWSAVLDRQRAAASMWPQQQGCGNGARGAIVARNDAMLQCGRSSKAAEMAYVLPCQAIKPNGFNVAAAARLRKSRRRLLLHGSQLRASMWPQQQGCGNAARRGLAGRHHGASMWPQQQGCGNHDGRAEGGQHRRASMWPQQQGCGNGRLGSL